MRTKSDFVNIELSAAGVEFAGKGGTVRITAAHLDYTFAAGKSVPVLTSEWSRLLSKRASKGKPILQIATPAPKPQPVAAPTAALPQAKEPQEKGK